MADNPFADLIPRRNAAERDNPFANLIPEQPSGASGYLGEFGKAFGRGAANLAGMLMKGGAAIQTTVGRELERTARSHLDVLDRIDRGETVADDDDFFAYRNMPEPERADLRARLTRGAEFYKPTTSLAEREAFKAGEFVSEAGRRKFPAAPGWEDSITAMLGEGTGSLVAGLPAAALGPGGAALVFGTAGAGEAAERAVKEGASEEQQLKSAMLGIAPGTTDIVPLEVLMGRLRVPLPLRGPLARAVGRIGGQAFVEGVQEGGQRFLQNLIAREVYKPEQSLSEGVLPESGVGAGVGGIAGTAREIGAGLVRLAAGRRGRGTVDAQPEEQREARPAAPGPFDDLIPAEPQKAGLDTIIGDLMQEREQAQAGLPPKAPPKSGDLDAIIGSLMDERDAAERAAAAETTDYDLASREGFTPSQMRKLLDEESEQIVGMWRRVKEPVPENASEHYRSVTATMARNLDDLGVFQARTEGEVRRILAERRRSGEMVQATRPDVIDATEPSLAAMLRREEPLFAVAGKDAAAQNAVEGAEDLTLADMLRGVSARQGPRVVSHARGERSRPIDWQDAMRPSRASPSSATFSWPAEAIDILRQGEGRSSYAELAEQLTQRFGVPVTTGMVSGKLRTLRGLNRTGWGRPSPSELELLEAARKTAPTEEVGSEIAAHIQARMFGKAARPLSQQAESHLSTTRVSGAAAAAKSPDASLRAALDDRFRRGSTATIRPEIAERIFDALRSEQAIVPLGVKIAVIAKIAPFRNFAETDAVRVYFRASDGMTFHEDHRWSELADLRAAFFPTSRAIGFLRFDLAGYVDHTLRGELRHELVHVLRRLRLLDDVTFDRLVSHADDLGIMNMGLRNYLTTIGHASAQQAPNIALGRIYARRYATRADFQEIIRQEAAAHLVELDTLGALLPEETAPVRGILDAIANGQISRGEPVSLAESLGTPPDAAFAGTKAKTADKRSLAEAEAMERGGAQPFEIRYRTGWERGADGAWRFEISDREARLTTTARFIASGRLTERTFTGRADQVIENPLVFEAYPELRNWTINVRHRRGAASGSVDLKARTIDVEAPSARQAVRKIAHEMQHAIQRKEGWAEGGSPLVMLGLVRKAMSALDGQAAVALERLASAGGRDTGLLLQRLADIRTERADLDRQSFVGAYQRLAGEVEARNVERRLPFKRGERIGTSMRFTEDVPRDQQIVHRGERGAQRSEDGDWQSAHWEAMARRGAAFEQQEWNEANRLRGLKRAPPKGYVESEAGRLHDAVTSFERNLLDEGLSVAEAAAEIERHFGFPVDPDQLAKRMVWWNIDEVLTREKRGTVEMPSPQRAVDYEPARGIGFDLSSGQREQAKDMAKRGANVIEIANRLSDASGKYVSVGAVAQIVETDAIKALSEVQKLYTSAELRGMTAKEAATHLSEKLGRSVTERAIYRGRQRAKEKGEAKGDARRRWTEEALDALTSDEIRSLSARQAAEILNARFPQFGGALNRGSVQAQRNIIRRGLTRGQRPATDDGVPVAALAEYFGRTGLDAVAERHGATAITKIRPWQRHPGPVLAFHGTQSDFSKFDIAKSRDFALHFGTPGHARNIVRPGTPLDRMLTRSKPVEGSRIFPVILDIRRPLDFVDNDWNPDTMIEQMEKRGVELDANDRINIRRADNRGDRAAAYRLIGEVLTRNGYDSLRYPNMVEGKGGWSYVVWETGKVKSATSPDVLFALSGHGSVPPAAPPLLPPPPPLPPPLPGLGGAQPPAPGSRMGRLESWKTRVLEYLQNSEERMRLIVNRVGQGRVPEQADPYLQATLYHGRVGSKVKRGYDEARAIIDDAGRLASATNSDLETVRGLVNDYLVARHAPERNRLLGDGAAGMTDAQAQHILTSINNRADAARIKAIADRALRLNEQSLDLLRDAGVITPALYSNLRTAYRHHVPLNRVFPDTNEFAGALAGRGFDVYSTGIKRAKGSSLDIADVLGNVLTNYEQAVLRSEKNLVDRATLEFVRRHSSQLGGLMRESRPRVIGTRRNGAPIFEQTQDPLVLHLFESGSPVWIKFGDGRLAAAFRGVNRDKLPLSLRFVGAITRLYSGLATRFNPEFALPNKIRDLQETLAYLAADRTVGAKGAAKAAIRDPASIKDVVDYLMGRNTPGARLYAEMKEAGGTTGGMGLSTREQVQLNIEHLEKLATSSPRRFAAKLVEYVDHWNTIFEDSTRLSVYKQALDSGLSQQRAAFLAKEASINFNRMGTAGPVVNALYMFSNASIQGSVKMMRTLKNPKVAAGLGVIIAVAVATVSEWNDEVDPDWRDKVSKWDRLNSLTIVLPSEEGQGVRYVAFPVSWGLKPLFVAASHAYDAASGKLADMKTILSDITTAILEAYNPVGGTDPMQAFTPTIGDLPLDIARNRSWSGSRIRPDFDSDLPRDKQYFMTLKDTQSGRAAITTTEALRDWTGILLSPADLAYATEQLVGGAGRSVRKTVDTIIGAGKGELPPADEFPFVSRFYRERAQEELGRGSAGEAEDIMGRRQDQSRVKFDLRDRADDAMREIEALPPEQRRAAFGRLVTQDRALAAAIAKELKMKALGLTHLERSIGRLGIENGERARYIVDEIRGMDAGQRRQYLDNLRKKGILTRDVYRQVVTLLAGRELRHKPQKFKPPVFPAPGQPGGNPFADLIPQ